ncbi:hypothetical protein EDEG_00827 [Edhazardia aedis USNM 41457]|uniref:Uncharacterized protein n=1 Tax=Edhazardia aedis (strain USNM 41457) TaxID=1003232 RepID=J9DBF4_EDHAE|nr:hypothetical protein EDEG_00827 [Edhazardia aedis USNM 41457]|eukprot:EJW05046.1 hypothetical protein EDEG_00827 [Edhazardia aedis USNM 41457]
MDNYTIDKEQENKILKQQKNDEEENDDVYKTYIIPQFKLMVQRTVKFEKRFFQEIGKKQISMYPLMEAAKSHLYCYYQKFLVDRIDKMSDPYIEEFLNGFKK